MEQNVILVVEFYPIKINGEVSNDIDNEAVEFYHSLINLSFKNLSAELIRRTNCKAIYAFKTPEQSVLASLLFFQECIDLNKQKKIFNDIDWPIQIGIHTVNTQTAKNGGLGTGQENQKHIGDFHDVVKFAEYIKGFCPANKILISNEVFDTLELTQRLFRPFFIEKEIQGFVLADRWLMTQENFFLNGLSERQKMAIPCLSYRDWDSIKPNEGFSLKELRQILEQPALIVLGGAYSDPKSPINSAAISDAVGIMEILAALNSNQDIKVGLDHWEDTADAALDRNIIIIGSGMVNTYAFALNDIFYPVHFVKTQGRCLDQIIATSKDRELHFGSHALPPKHSGLIAISKNPFSINKYMLWVAGITGIATQSTYGFLKDILLHANDTIQDDISIFLEQNLPIACVIGPDQGKMDKEWTTANYYDRLRIPSYQVLWMVDRDGKEVVWPSS